MLVWKKFKDENYADYVRAIGSSSSSDSELDEDAASHRVQCALYMCMQCVHMHMCTWHGNNSDDVAQCRAP